MSMNLKPFRDIDEHEVVNLFSTSEGDVSKGTFVELVSFDPDNHNGPGASLDGLPEGVYSPTWEVYAKVRKATSTTGAVGLLLVDVVSTNANVVTVQDSHRYFDKIPSGKAVPFLKRGLVEIGGFSGTPYPGAKGIINGSGILTVASPVPVTGSGGALAQPANVGTFLSSSGADGFAVFQVNCI